MSYYCQRCGALDESIRTHVCATNKDATNRIATNKAGTGGGLSSVVQGSTAGTVPRAAKKDGASPKGGRTANRRSREAYNTYQRDLMRKRRAVQHG
jgi:hypothetical protein